MPTDMEFETEVVNVTSPFTDFNTTEVIVTEPTTEAPDDGLGTDVIVGIVIGCVVLVIIVIIIIVCCLKRRKKNGRRASQMRPKSKKRWSRIWRNITKRTGRNKQPPSLDELNEEEQKAPPKKKQINNAYDPSPVPSQKSYQKEEDPIHMCHLNVVPRRSNENKEKPSDRSSSDDYLKPDPQGSTEPTSDQMVYTNPDEQTTRTYRFEDKSAKKPAQGYISMDKKSPTKTLHDKTKDDIHRKGNDVRHVLPDDSIDTPVPAEGHSSPSSPPYYNVIAAKQGTQQYENVHSWTQSCPDVSMTSDQNNKETEKTRVKHTLSLQNPKEAKDYMNYKFSPTGEFIEEDSANTVENSNPDENSNTDDQYYNTTDDPQQDEYYNVNGNTSQSNDRQSEQNTSEQEEYYNKPFPYPYYNKKT